MQRAQQPNLGLWSPPGGKLKIETGESPHQCACREASEELLIQVVPSQIHLTGIVSEVGYQGAAHWLMFLFEILPKIPACPPPHREGLFQFFERRSLDSLSVPKTDREQIWPLFWKHRGGFFCAHCRCLPGEQHEWSLEASVLRPGGAASPVG